MDYNKKSGIQALDDDLLDQVAGGCESDSIPSTNFFTHTCLKCNKTFTGATTDTICPNCKSKQ